MKLTNNCIIACNNDQQHELIAYINILLVYNQQYFIPVGSR